MLISKTTVQAVLRSGCMAAALAAMAGCAPTVHKMEASLFGESANAMQAPARGRPPTKVQPSLQKKRQKDECVSLDAAGRLLCRGFFDEGASHD